MTRETKIGLLVGLAFMIMVCILLSDHVSSVNESPVASLQVAGSTLRSSLGEQGNGDDVTPILHNPMAIVPRQHVPTHEEVSRHSDGPGVVLVNPGNLNFTDPQQTPQPRQPDPRSDTVAQRLHREALARGEDIEPVNPNDGRNALPPVEPIKPVNPVQPKTVAAGYKAQSGDTLGTIAQHALGANNKANREAIVAANPSLQSNRNLIVAGRTYTIPTIASGRAAAVPAPSPVTPVANETITPPANDPGNIYVVQSGDTLWSIAVTELGSSSEVAAIKDLNQDQLGDSDNVRPNMKLRLPGKKVAAAN